MSEYVNRDVLENLRMGDLAYKTYAELEEIKSAIIARLKIAGLEGSTVQYLRFYQQATSFQEEIKNSYRGIGI